MWILSLIRLPYSVLVFVCHRSTKIDMSSLVAGSPCDLWLVRTLTWENTLSQEIPVLSVHARSHGSARPRRRNFPLNTTREKYPSWNLNQLFLFSLYCFSYSLFSLSFFRSLCVYLRVLVFRFLVCFSVFVSFAVSPALFFFSLSLSPQLLFLSSFYLPHFIFLFVTGCLPFSLSLSLSPWVLHLLPSILPPSAGGFGKVQIKAEDQLDLLNDWNRQNDGDRADVYACHSAFPHKDKRRSLAQGAGIKKAYSERDKSSDVGGTGRVL